MTEHSVRLDNRVYSETLCVVINTHSDNINYCQLVTDTGKQVELTMVLNRGVDKEVIPVDVASL